MPNANRCKVWHSYGFHGTSQILKNLSKMITINCWRCQSSVPVLFYFLSFVMMKLKAGGLQKKYLLEVECYKWCQKFSLNLTSFFIFTLPRSPWCPSFHVLWKVETLQLWSHILRFYPCCVVDLKKRNRM